MKITYINGRDKLGTAVNVKINSVPRRRTTFVTLRKKIKAK